MAYKYISPLNQGMKQFKLTKEQHNKLFNYRKIKWCDRYEYYYDNHHILLHKYSNILVIIFETILYPINLLINGLGNFQDINQSFYRLYNQKKTGRFSEDSVRKGSELYSEVMTMIKKSE